MKRKNTLIDLERLVFLMSCHFCGLVFYHYYTLSEHWVGVLCNGRNCSNHIAFVCVKRPALSTVLRFYIYDTKYWVESQYRKERSAYKPLSLLGRP